MEEDKENDKKYLKLPSRYRQYKNPKKKERKYNLIAIIN